jgi:hypothetical protein
VPAITAADKPASTPLRETTTRLLVHAEQPKARRHVGCARRDRRERRSAEAHEPTAAGPRRLPTRGSGQAISSSMAGASLWRPTATARLCRYVHRIGVSRTTPHSRRIRVLWQM